MSFREINHKNNEEYWERLELVMERIEAVSEEEASSVEELYRGYFFEMSELFLVLYKLAEASLSGKLAEISTLEGKKINRRLYLDVQEDYADSYANPAYAVSKMGWEYGPLLSALDARLHGIYTSCMEGNIRYQALTSGKVDVIDAFETDAILKKMDLVKLEDDIEFFPPYQAVSITRNETLKKYPQLQEVMDMMEGAITTEEMMDMNYQVDVEGKTPKETAVEFLKEKGMIE